MRMLQTTRAEAALRGPFLPADLAFPDSLRPPQCSSADRRRVRHLTPPPITCGVRNLVHLTGHFLVVLGGELSERLQRHGPF